MRLCDTGTLTIEPGELIRWQLTAVGEPASCDAGPSENETFHLAGLEEGRSGWLAMTVELPGRPDPGRIGAAIDTLLARHAVLRGHFRPDDAGWRRFVHAPSDLVVRRLVDGEMPLDRDTPPHRDALPADPREVAQTVLAQIAATCDPRIPGRHYFAAVRRPESTTLVCAFDHCYVDARSLAVVSAEILACLAGRPNPEPGPDYLDIRRAEDAEPVPAPDDPRLTGWSDFLAEHGWSAPDFPLDLGVPVGTTAPMYTVVTRLLDADGAAALADTMRDRGARLFPTLLACLGAAVRSAGGPSTMPVIIPVGTRASESSDAVGWLVGNAPLAVDCDTDLISAAVDTTRRLPEAVALSEIGLTPVYTTFADRIRRTRADVFMVSYVDYRRLETTGDVVTQQVSSEHETDTAQWWFWRDGDGIGVRVRCPDTPRGRRVIDQVVAETVSACRAALRPVAA